MSVYDNSSLHFVSCAINNSFIDNYVSLLEHCINKLHGAESLSSYSRNSLYFMEPADS